MKDRFDEIRSIDGKELDGIRGEFLEFLIPLSIFPDD